MNEINYKSQFFFSAFPSHEGSRRLSVAIRRVLAVNQDASIARVKVGPPTLEMKKHVGPIVLKHLSD